MDYSVCEISNTVMIDSLDAIIQEENWKLEMDKNTGLLSKKSKTPKVQQSFKENENKFKQNIPHRHLRSYSPKRSHSCDRVEEIERLANLFTQSPSFFSTNNNNNSIHVEYNQRTSKENLPIQRHNEFDDYKDLVNYKNNNNSIVPDIKVKRNVRFGEFSPLNPANQVNAQPFLGIGEYDNKKKKMLELQRKEYMEYVSKVKQDKNTSDLPKLADYSCEEAFKTAMEDNSISDQTKSDIKSIRYQENIKQPFVDGAESCTSDEDHAKETNRLKQEIYRLELSKQIEEKKRLELERKRQEQMEDEAIERMAREQEERIRKEYEQEMEKRTLAQLQKQLQQEKLQNEIKLKQKELELKARNADKIETTSQPVSMHTPSYHESFEDPDEEEFHCPPESTFDNVPLPTSRIRVPRKIVYDDEPVNKNTRNVSCNTDVNRNSHLNQSISPPALMPDKKAVIIDSPYTLALAGLNNCEDNDGTCEAIEPTEAVYRNQNYNERLLENNHELIDTHLLSNLGSIRKQLDIEHQRLKEQVRRSQ
ncbi:general transcriptional corepressor trfA-like isoform X2 [Sipha flava]|uniref:General transcriptional corepressor trfA-like isoform X2 n=1 Tax=Sipha flava TaxID=143950 RepID=A0A2S2QL90_9HEMI|nr:general transcriptional corepressor trfA-like isoform X2 [Sipha flava]